MTAQELAPLAILGWALLLAYYITWRIGHEKRMAELRRQLEEINKPKESA